MNRPRVRRVRREAGLIVLLTALIGLAILHGPEARAASFDCTKAKTPEERAICADPKLSDLDSQMGALWQLYSQVPMLMGGTAERRDGARAFLAARARCGSDTACLNALYVARIGALRDALKPLPSNEKSTPPGATAIATPAPAPGPVMELVGRYYEACNRLGGRPSDNSLPDMMTADLDHDGLPDYVLNPQNLHCIGASPAFCANDGCAIDIALSSKGYQQPVEARGSIPVLVQGTETTRLFLKVSRFQCNAAPGAACWADYLWANGALTPAFSTNPPAP
ncbi:hypothetical protein MWN34_01095 [Ancylobacter sp. 6x-1]|uniref:DUF1311 domain-containing protein n=1 Tax=Ancylobacter crimeensis TaxID=2579147 RepID=A0ABT0D6D3_9HYPH|nr:hypothetical protein [Ancylobacter crimeensis]MCK0195502.1 hypothetical protein [Ancylobacter crimeensis]